MQELITADEAVAMKRRPQSQNLNEDVPEETILTLRDELGNSALHLMFKLNQLAAVKYVL